MLNRIIFFFLNNRLVSALFLLTLIGWGLVTSPFNLTSDLIPRDPVAVDAIPDIGENQQIVFTKWEGRSPQDVEDQITYPLTSALLGLPGVKSVRSNSMFGFSSIYLIFEEHIDYYWSRSRILEKLASLPENTLPSNVSPTLGPDATALGQIFWYTLEGQDQKGNTTGGWDLHELRSLQDYYVRYGLSSAQGVAEVASIGGHVKQYQIDLRPEVMRELNVNLNQVLKAVSESNLDVGSQTMEINNAEYYVRGLGYLENLEDLRESVVTSRNNVPIRISDVAHISLGPAPRRGILDKSGAEVVGGVVVARYGSNPMEVIKNVKSKIKEIEHGLPQKILDDGTTSKVTIVPFYDRTDLINETLGTLEEALTLEILITVLVVLLMLFNLRSSFIVAASLPIAVLMCFIAMRYFKVDANIVALSGIAIAIGTMVDMGIVLVESIQRRLDDDSLDENLVTTVYEASTEVAGAVLTAVATTIISFLPVFTMEAAEGKLFRPLAFTKSFALLASVLVAIAFLPSLARIFFNRKRGSGYSSLVINLLLLALGITMLNYQWTNAHLLILIGLIGLLLYWSKQRFSEHSFKKINVIYIVLLGMIVTWLLANIWLPLGVEISEWANYLFLILLTGLILIFFYALIKYYEQILQTLLKAKLLFFLFVFLLIFQGYRVFNNSGEEFMPALNEGSFLLMPTAMPHASVAENAKNLRLLDMAVTAIPEVEMVVGKAGRVNSALDPAPLSMYENVILYKSEYKTDEKGHRSRFLFENNEYVRDDDGNLISDKNGKYYRQWREHINSPDDIWQEIVNATEIPGVTSAPKLQPIETRLVMLQTGMRAPMGIKIKGSDLKTIEDFGIVLSEKLIGIEGVKEAAVFADRIIGKPYLQIRIDRKKIARYGLTIEQVQKYIQTAIGGKNVSTTIEGRERYDVIVRYPRELRSSPEDLSGIYIDLASGATTTLGEVANIEYEAGPQSIKSEDGFLVGYVLFDKLDGYSEVQVVENVKNQFDVLIDQGDLIVPEKVSFKFSGNYEQQV